MRTSGPERSIAYRPDIDGLRAVAVGLVLLFHGFPSISRSGFIGVDVFFVLSGYLITSILLKSSARSPSVRDYLLDFYRHRLRRIFPALIVVLVACAVYGWFRLFPADYENLTKYIAAGAGFVSNFVLSTESGYFDAGAELKPLTHLWSLAIEEQFYLVWPVVVLVLTRIARGRYLPAALGVLTAASFVFGVYLTFRDPTAAYYSPLSRGWELGVGGLLAVLHARGKRARPGRASEIISVVALLVIPVGAVTFIESSQFPGWHALVPVLATAALIWFGSGTWVDRRFLGTRPIVWIGLISYPLYLWHWVVLAFLRIEYPAPPGVLVLAALGLSVVLAAATYLFVEKPIRRLPLTRVSVAVLVAMAVVLVYALAATTLRWSGVQLTPTQQKLSQAYDPRPDYRFERCFLDSATQGPADFAPECTDDAAAGQPSAFLWGDSLVAQLYPGMAQTRDVHGFAIVQRTASSCPAATADVYGDRGNCNALNAAIRDEISRDQPDTVILDGRWPEDADQREAQLRDLSEFLTASGVQHVVLVGPAPDWYPDLRGMLVRQEFPDDVLPERLPPPDTWPATVARDESLREVAGELGMDYISLVDLLCDDGGCLIRVSEEIPDGLVTSDHDHLTAQASEFVFRKLAADGFWTTLD